MWSQFLFEIAHFAISFIVALVFLAAFWLYFDSKARRHSFRDYIRISGFLLLSISYVVSAVILETSIMSVPLFGNTNMVAVQLFLRSLGYLFIFIAAVTDKMQPRPKQRETLAIIPTLGSFVLVAQFFPAVLALCVAVAYLVRSSIGLEAHMKKAAGAFFFFAISESLMLFALFRSTDNVTLFHLVQPFGVIWMVQHLVLLLGTLILAKWVFGYLLKQFQPQLFIIFSVGVLSIFLITTTTFTSLLFNNIQVETLRQLENDVKVLNYALNSKKAEAISNVSSVAHDPEVAQMIIENKRQELGTFAEKLLLSKQYSSVLIINADSQIIARGEDQTAIGSYVSDDPLIKRVKEGQALAAMTASEGVFSPQITLQAAAPIESDGKKLGVVMIAMNLDNAFVDGIKSETGLEASLYGNSTLSATTLMAADKKSRLIGLIESNPAIIKKVLTDSQNYSGSVTIGNTSYFVVDAPLLDADNNPIGMLSVGRDQLGVLRTASRSMELTFVFAAALIVFSIIPSYVVSRYISNQLH